MNDRRSRVMNRYRTHRPVEDEGYIRGTRDALKATREGVQVDCPYHIDSNKGYRWFLGYSDELLYIASYLYSERKHPSYDTRVRGSSTIPIVKKSKPIYSRFSFSREDSP